MDSPRQDGQRALLRELFAGRFRAVVSDMGELLRRMSFSINVKERLDFSCALLDARGRLVVNAPHIPVHLGALGVCVRRVLEEHDLERGDVVVTNHPAFGGSHLPDVTMIGPVFAENTCLGFLASRAHHAEIGGTRPGSMPPDATTLIEEGVVIAPTFLMRSGEANWSTLEALLREGPFPSRSAEENLADLRGALAAHRHAERLLQGLAQAHGTASVVGQMQELFDEARRQMTVALSAFGDCDVEAVEHLDDGARLSVHLRVREGRASFDFAGTSPTQSSNFNAGPAIVRSAVLYCLRLLLDTDLPLNEGLLEVVDIVIPEGCLLNPIFSADPAQCPAVVAGNVETSQRLVDCLIKALGLLSGGQGTMNNLVFGNEQFGYYETLCGGAGAGDGFEGASAVHTHMTNTRITDAEILELRYPVRVEEFSIRRDSGGVGAFRGGDGARRSLLFLEPAELSFLSQHRIERPFALAGGSPGECGRQWIERRTGEIEKVAGVSSTRLEAGDTFVVETPSGSGWGTIEG